MAILKAVNLQSGLNVEGAYIRIDTVSGSKSELTISVNTYVSRESFKDGKGYMSQKSYTFVPSVLTGSENFIKQGYEYLKGTPEYTEFVNVPTDCSAD